jgi:hypothetical protein
MNITIIYEIHRNNIPIYIGKSPNPKTRINAHCNNFGKDVKMIYIDEVPTKDWEYWEKYWIAQYKLWGFKLENITHGGNGLSFHKQESKDKISEKVKGRVSPSKGRKMSEEEKQLRSQKAKERFDKNNHPSKGKVFDLWPTGENHGHFSKEKSIEQKQQMSKSAIKRHERQNNNQ